MSFSLIFLTMMYRCCVTFIVKWAMYCARIEKKYWTVVDRCCCCNLYVCS